MTVLKRERVATQLCGNRWMAAVQ